MQGNVIAFGIDYTLADVATRESVEVEQIQIELQRLIGRGYLTITTCNRLFFILYAEIPVSVIYSKCIGWFHKYFFYEGIEAVRYLFSVYSGLMSMVVGETQIAGQIRKTYAKNFSHLGPVLNKLLQSCFRVGKEVRQFGVNRGSISVASLAAKRLHEYLGDGADVLIIGAGETARLFAEHCKLNKIICNRDEKRAEELAKSVGAEVLGFAAYKDAIISQRRFDGIVGACSLGIGEYLLTGEDFSEALLGLLNQKILIDLGVPRNFHPKLRDYAKEIIDLDEIQQIANSNLEIRRNLVDVASGVISNAAVSYMRWLKFHDYRQKFPELDKLIQDKYLVTKIFSILQD